MAIIHVLDDHTIDKIAAGEVIDRPASIVKELVENAIDAGAGAVTVEIKDGGISFIRITDNGCGIEKEDVKTAFLRHATSKINSVEDLITIASLGFRGEALSSIAAVSQVELVTKTANSLTGIRYQIHGGKAISYDEIGCPEGTTFIVRNLFYNTPARRKFLKTGSTEASHIDALMQRLALSHPNISIKFINNNQNKIYTSGNGNLKDIIYHLYGKEVAANLIPIDAACDSIKITGFIAKPYVSRGNRNYENYFVNGRYVKSAVINQAIEEGYRTYTMVHKYPFVALDFQINSTLIDVNVHPNKMELRFSNSETLYQFIMTAVREGLMEKILIPTVSVDKDQVSKRVNPSNIAPEPFEKQRIEQVVIPKTNPYSMRNPSVSQPIVDRAKLMVDALIPDTIVNEGMKPVVNETVPEEMTKQVTNEVVIEEATRQAANEAVMEEERNSNEAKVVMEESSYPEINSSTKQINFFEENTISNDQEVHHTVIGQLFKTYWLIEKEGTLFIMDQHAAHEKVMYEQLIHKFANKEIFSQVLEPPMIVTLNMKEVEAITTYKDYFNQLGFTIEAFGGDEYCIRSVPANLYGLCEQELFIELIDSISDNVGLKDPSIITDKIASMSCKAAVKGNQKLTYKEIEGLITELLSLENPYTCPHGRPTIIAMTKTDIEKKFKRIQS